MDELDFNLDDKEGFRRKQKDQIDLGQRSKKRSGKMNRVLGDFLPAYSQAFPKI